MIMVLLLIITLIMIELVMMTTMANNNNNKTIIIIKKKNSGSAPRPPAYLSLRDFDFLLRLLSFLLLLLSLRFFFPLLLLPTCMDGGWGRDLPPIAPLIVMLGEGRVGRGVAVGGFHVKPSQACGSTGVSLFCFSFFSRCKNIFSRMTNRGRKSKLILSISGR